MDDIDMMKVFEEGGKAFDLYMSQANDEESDSSSEPYIFTAPTSDKTVSDNEAAHSYDVFSLKVDGNNGKEISFDDVYVDFSAKTTPEEVKLRKNKNIVDDALKKSVLVPDFEKLECVPPYEISRRKLLHEKRKKRESTKGEKWFNMPAVEVTDEIKHDLQVLQMRSALDPKQFYKKNVMKDIPKYFQMGTVVESPADFYSSRIPKKQRKQTMVDELLADAEFQKYNKQRYHEIIEGRRKSKFKGHRHANRLKRKGKSRK